jgi:phosphogluconate dehydratase
MILIPDIDFSIGYSHFQSGYIDCTIFVVLLHYLFRQSWRQPALSRLDATVKRVTDAVRRRSADTRARYLQRIDAAIDKGPVRKSLSCTNQAHAFAAFPQLDRDILVEMRQPSIAIISAYNDMLSAHQPLQQYPELIKQSAREVGAVAQFAGGVPAMCDGVTQGQPGMELSLFSRDTIALSAAVALSHNSFDAALYLGVCDKIVPGLLMAALSFGHLPAIFVPAGPMTSGMPNDEKARIRQLFAEGKIDRGELLAAELRSYHGPGTCTFYGTANSNQMLMEVMGLHLPGAAFINPGTALRDLLTRAAAQRAAAITHLGDAFTPLGKLVDEKTIVNAIVGLLATGGSTNHSLHLVAIARCAGIAIDWNDFSKLSSAVPLLACVYPNGKADVNQFHAAGGMGFLIRELIAGGYLHADVQTVVGPGLARYAEEPWLDGAELAWRPASTSSGDGDILRGCAAPFSSSGGLQLLEGNLGRAMIKISAVKPEHRVVRAPAIVFDNQEQVMEAFQAGELERDFIAVVRNQGPRSNGMPELHKLTPPLGVLQGRGFKVALVTDGRMSGASGKIPAAIHLTPECQAGGMISRIRDGDEILLDAERGVLSLQVDEAELQARSPAAVDPGAETWGLGRELFDGFRARVSGAEQGAMSIYTEEPARGRVSQEAPVHDH